MTDRSRSVGRYDDVQSAQHPGQQLPRAPRHMRGKIEIRVGAVPDPNPIFGERLKRQRVAINIAASPLEHIYGHGRISAKAYNAGRAYADLMEIKRGRAMASSNGEPRSRTSNSAEYAIVKKIHNAQQAIRLLEGVRDAIGARPAKLLERVLADGMSFGDAAYLMWRRRSQRARLEVSRRFCEALESLAEHWG